ncbi:MAG TPA: SxtJ family membrane protein [Bryobacteraceae bacterium]|nr:SxtJ family membrane protein [Bryobacteraceae bacterium]
MNTRLHEDLHRTHQTKGFSDRSFAVTFCVFFLLLALLPLRRHQPVQWRWMIASGVFLAVGLVAPGLLHPVSRAWAKLALLLHKIVNPITTAVLYFLIFVPAGYLFRMLGKDPLRLKLEPRAESYWIPRSSAEAASGSMRNQF